MKRLLFTMLMTLFLITGAGVTTAPAAARDSGREISVEVDGLPVEFDVSPVILDGRTLVPFRALAEALGVKVSWNGEKMSVTAEKGGTVLVMRIGTASASLNGSPLALEVPPVLMGGRTLIPARVFGEAFGCRVGWDGAAGLVKILSPPSPMTVTAFYALGDSATSSWKNLFGKPFPGTGAGNLLTKSRTGWERPEGWEGVLKAAADYKLKTEMVVHMADGDGALSALLASLPASEKAASGIAGEARLYRGVNLDLEGLGWREENAGLAATKSNFTRFVGLLSSRLKAAGLELTVTLHPPNSAYVGYDYGAVGRLADWIVVMAYDYGPRPEPADMVAQAVRAAVAEVPPEKVLLGISAPSETPESITAKAGIARKYGLGGIALWRLGLVPDGMWNSLRDSLKAVK